MSLEDRNKINQKEVDEVINSIQSLLETPFEGCEETVLEDAGVDLGIGLSVVCENIFNLLHRNLITFADKTQIYRLIESYVRIERMNLALLLDIPRKIGGKWFHRYERESDPYLSNLIKHYSELELKLRRQLLKNEIIDRKLYENVCIVRNRIEAHFIYFQKFPPFVNLPNTKNKIEEIDQRLKILSLYMYNKTKGIERPWYYPKEYWWYPSEDNIDLIEPIARKYFKEQKNEDTKNVN